MCITVISQTTSEREQETVELFLKCKPYLDKGMGLVDACQIVKKTKHNQFYPQRWYKDLKAYAESQGYKINRR